MADLIGIPVVESSLLPVPPSDGEVARRLVRHGMADVLRWLGEEPGPSPDALMHAVVIGDTLHVSAALVGEFIALGERRSTDG